jgi:hypothetical protein
MRLDEAVELLPAEGGPDLLVMELATGGERTIDGIADGERVLLGHAKTREAMRAGLAMYFVTLDDPELMAIADRIVAELGIEHFFNIQLVGEHVIEINPRISTIVYQENLNLPYLGVKHALGEITPDELAALRPLIWPGRTALRYFDQLEWDAEPQGGSSRTGPWNATPPSTARSRPACRGRTCRRCDAEASTQSSSCSTATRSTRRRTGRSSGTAASCAARRRSGGRSPGSFHTRTSSTSSSA